MLELWTGQPVDWRVNFEFEQDGQGEATQLRPGPAAGVITVGLGPRASLTPEMCRRAAAEGVRWVRTYHGASAVLDATPVVEALGQDGLEGLFQGAALAAHTIRNWKSGAQDALPALYVDGAAEHGAQLRRSLVLTDGVCFARDLVNEPANLLTPGEMARRMAAAAVAAGIEAQVLEEAECRDLGMEAFLTVGGSAAHRPCLIVLRYRGGPADMNPIALVGKGITCDTGGYCIKPGASMKGIRGDMAGGAAVCGALLALAGNHIPVNAVAVIPAAENRISPDSFLPGDVIPSMSGKTIEIGNTDAEGRLILADAITYALQKEGCDRVVDICTLTGAVVSMFGFTTAGLMTNDETFYADFTAAARRSGEQYWRLPTFPEYKKLIESPVADLYNTSTDGCGTIAAGLFLGAFAGETPWIHLDIAGTAWVDTPKWAYQSKWATGAGVTTLYELCRGMAERR